MKQLNTIDGATLMSQPLRPLNFVVDTLLSPGLHILAGSPKVGKSWLALWLAVTVAKREAVWGMAVRRGTTLYLCLEDSTLRIQNRLFQITEDAPDNVHFGTESCILGRGLEEQLEAFFSEHQDMVLVIIDTLQIIRGLATTTPTPTTTGICPRSKRLQTSTASWFYSSTICGKSTPTTCSAASPVPPPSAARWISASRWWPRTI